MRERQRDLTQRGLCLFTSSRGTGRGAACSLQSSGREVIEKHLGEVAIAGILIFAHKQAVKTAFELRGDRYLSAVIADWYCHGVHVFYIISVAGGALAEAELTAQEDCLPSGAGKEERAKTTT